MTDHQREEKKDKHKESRRIGFLVDINLRSDGLVACQLLHSFAYDIVPDMYEKVNVIKTKTKAWKILSHGYRYAVSAGYVDFTAVTFSPFSSM